MTDLFQFLTELALDVKNQERFARNPKAVMDAAGLSAADKRVLGSQDRANIAAAFADELSTDEFAAVMGSCFVGDPGPDPTPDPDPPEDSGDA